MSHASAQEGLWVLRAQCNDREALELLLRCVEPSLRRYLVGLVGGADADDVLQDVLMVVCRKLTRLETPELFRPWAFRIASRAVLCLHFQEDMTLPDIAAVLEVPIGTVESRLAYGLAALRKTLGRKR